MGFLHPVLGVTTPSFFGSIVGCNISVPKIRSLKERQIAQYNQDAIFLLKTYGYDMYNSPVAFAPANQTGFGIVSRDYYLYDPRSSFFVQVWLFCPEP